MYLSALVNDKLLLLQEVLNAVMQGGLKYYKHTSVFLSS